MRTDEFDYHLPTHRIAQSPLPNRDDSKLMVVRRQTQSIEHLGFRDLPDLLQPADLLVFNDTKVIPARLRGTRARTGGRWEGLFIAVGPDGAWELMSQTRGRLTEGERIVIEAGGLLLELIRKTANGTWIAMPSPPHAGNAYEILEKHGLVPLPPYIRKGVAAADDRDRYQTIYAQVPGAVAAPTAGLHFTPRILERLTERGIRRAFVTLHVGVGTFRPIQVDHIEHHRMHSEWASVERDAVVAVQHCKTSHRRMIAVGTTTVRTLEFAARGREFGPFTGMVDLYITPPFSFQIVDALITNFHLPRSSLLVLVSAFAGVDLMRHAYREAIESGYRFYSYGDAMLIL
jgi:S-adenosylmethionine:tRNA ribosyltransferase-isomerase